jgi:hypothetical protein
MPSYSWIKLYHEILRDPKMGRLPDSLWRRAIECFLLAGEHGKNGFLPGALDMAWILRSTPDEIEASLQELANVGIVEIRDGQWYVTHFADRQAPIKDDERKSSERDRKRKEKYYNRDTGVTGGVTTRDTDTDKIRLESEKIKEEDGADAPAATPPDAPASQGSEPADSKPIGYTNESLMIVAIVGGEVLKREWDTCYASQGKRAPVNFANAQQRDAYIAVCGALGDEFEPLVKKAIKAERTSRTTLLQYLEGCVKNRRPGSAVARGNGHHMNPADVAADRALERARGNGNH